MATAVALAYPNLVTSVLRKKRLALEEKRRVA